MTEAKPALCIDPVVGNKLLGNLRENREVGNSGRSETGNVHQRRRGIMEATGRWSGGYIVSHQEKAPRLQTVSLQVANHLSLVARSSSSPGANARNRRVK
jgi:hypothetical protein